VAFILLAANETFHTVIPATKSADHYKTSYTLPYRVVVENPSCF